MEGEERVPIRTETFDSELCLAWSMVGRRNPMDESAQRPGAGGCTYGGRQFR